MRLENWLDSLIGDYDSRILPLDTLSAQIWGKLMASFPVIAMEGSQIAAIAAANGMTVATRNVKHFAHLGAPYFDPFQG